MTGQEKLQEYNEALQEANKAQARVNVVENELRQMVHSFFADCRGGWYFNSMKYGENTTELCVEEVSMGEGEDYCFPVPTSIILKYLDGNTEEATKEFQKWHKGYREQKRREEEERKRQEEEALAKADAEKEYNLFLKLKQKFEGNQNEI
jgi:hypothetical protein